MTSFVSDTGEYLDYSGEDIPFTKQAASIFNFQISGDFSIDFTLQNTSTNRSALGYYGAQQLTSPARSRQGFTMIKNGNTFSKGYLIIKGSDSMSINCFFISGNANWFNLLQFNIKDIDYEQFVVAINSIDARKASTEGITFPIVDYAYNGMKLSTEFLHRVSESNSNDDNQLQEIFPWFYLHSLVDSIATYSQVKIQGDLLADPLFNKVIISPSGPDMAWPDSILQKTYAVVGRSSNQATSGAGITLVSFDTTIDQGSLNLFNLSSSSYMADRTCTIKVTYNLNFLASQAWIIIPRINGTNTDTLSTGITTSQIIAYAYYNLSKGDVWDLTMQVALGGTLLSTSFVRIEIEKTIPGYLYNGNGLSSGGDAPYIMPFVTPAAIIPDVKAIDIIKWITMRFGCVCSFDEFSQTLSINKIAGFKKEEAHDWSDYFVSHKLNWQTGAAANNFIQNQETSEDDIIKFNEQSLVNYGGGNLTTSFDVTQNRELYTEPVGGMWDQPNKINMGWAQPFCKFYELQDDTSLQMTVSSVDSSAGLARFNGTCPFSANQVVRINSTNGEYTGYGVIVSAAAGSFRLYGVTFKHDTTCTVYKQSFSAVSSANRIGIAFPGATITDYGGPSSYTFRYWGALTRSVSSSTACGVWFDKPIMNLPIDAFKVSLALKTIGNKTYNITCDQVYLQSIQTVFNNPMDLAVMVLPLSIFINFDFSTFVYLQTEELTGYFLVGKISNYLDSDGPITVELYYAD